MPPPLRFDILEEIEKRIPGFPIVLHGASSVRAEVRRDDQQVRRQAEGRGRHPRGAAAQGRRLGGLQDQHRLRRPPGHDRRSSARPSPRTRRSSIRASTSARRATSSRRSSSRRTRTCSAPPDTAKRSSTSPPLRRLGGTAGQPDRALRPFAARAGRAPPPRTTQPGARAGGDVAGMGLPVRPVCGRRRPC